MSSTPSSSSERTIACEPVITVGGTTLFGPRTGETAAISVTTAAWSAVRSARSGALGAPADLVAISEGLIGDPLLIGLFLVDHWCFLELRKIKKPLSLAALRGVARDGTLPVGLCCHALGKDDGYTHSGADGNGCYHAVSFPSE